MNKVRDQDNSAQCVAYSVCAIKEQQEARDVNYKGFFSPDYIYDLRKSSGNKGMTARRAMEILKNHGAVPDIYYRGNDDDHKTASLYKIDAYSRVILWKTANVL